MASDLSCVQVPTEESKADFASQQKPWLLVTDGENYHIQNSMFNNKPLPNCYYDVGGEIPEFVGRTIACFYQEWVLLYGSYDDGLPEVLVNLLTKETIELPLMDFSCDFCVLTSPPSDPNCHVVFFHKAEEKKGEQDNGEQENAEEENGEENENSFIIWQPGDKKYTIRKWDYEIYARKVYAVVAGKLFLEILKDGRYVMIVVEFKESRYGFEVLQIDDREHEYRGSWRHYFFEYSGELFAVYKILCGGYSENVAGIKIFKADLLNKEWVRIKNLGRLAIFIGYNTAHCAAVDSGITANSVYFLEEDDLDSYYVYNLDEGTVRMKPILCSMETTEDTELDWIMMQGDPSFPKLLKDHQESISQDSEKENKSSMEHEVEEPWNILYTMLNWMMMVCNPSFPKILKDDQESIRQDSRIETKSSGEVEQDEVKESWNMVPPELLNSIQLRLFGRDYAVFCGVCKAWQQSSMQWQQASIQCQKTSFQDYSIPSLLSSATLLEQCESCSPLLMYQEDVTSSYDSVPVFRFFDPVLRKLYRTRIPELKEAEIQYSADGWLLVLRSSDQSLFFFNPLTREKIELPRLPPLLLLPHRAAITEFLSFSSPPTYSNCLVVVMDRFGLELYTLKHGDETWREHYFDYIAADSDEDSREYRSNIVVLNGLHYFMCENRDMVIFNLKNGTEGQEIDRQICPSKFRRSIYVRGEDFLVEVDGGPAFVSVGPNGGEINISKWNDLKKDWELMEGGVEFGGKDMFLSKRCSFMEKIDDVGGIGNNIFLPMIDESKDGVFYSLASRKYHTFYSGYSLELPYDVDKFLNGVWVKPDRKIVGQNNLQWLI